MNQHRNESSERRARPRARRRTWSLEERVVRVALRSLRFSITGLLRREPGAVLRGAKWSRLERSYLLAALQAASKSVPLTARLLGVHRRTVERQLNRRSRAR